MKIFSQDLMSAIKESQSAPTKYVRFSVYGYYLDGQGNEQTDGVTVTITADGYTQGAGNYIDVPLGTAVTYTVTKQDYETEGPFSCTVTGPSTIRVPLTNLPMWQFTVTPVPNDSTISMVSGNRTSDTGTISVPQGSTVTYSISHTGMNPYSGSRLIPQNPQETNPITETRTLTSTISINSVTPADATIMWTPGVGDPVYGFSCTAPCTSTVGLTITKPGYDTITATYPASGYLVNSNLGDITMTKTSLTCSLSCNAQDALISMWKEEEGVEVPGSRVTGYSSVVINCVMDDDIHWSVEKQYYVTQTGHVVMGTTDVVLPPVTLLINNYVVTITSVPAEALITVYAGAAQLGQARGGVSVAVDANTYITYNATLGGVTESGSATITANYTDELTLSATAGGAVTLVDSSQTISLPYGKYKMILVGGGAGGRLGDSAYVAARVRRGGHGGPGGGSGYATIETIQIDNYEGQSVVFNIGAGGASATAGNPTSVVVGNTTYTANGGSIGANTIDGGAGGSGGGAGGWEENHPNASTYLGTDGGNGGLGGGNGETKSRNLGGTTVNTANGGIGYYNQIKSYENNYGAQISAVQNGNPGGGGTGLVSIAATLTTASTFMSLTNVQTLYNSLGGGGGGGPTGVPSSSVAIYGGPGGGGGSWTAGSAGTAGAPGSGGTGGSGAVLYMRIDWN